MSQPISAQVGQLMQEPNGSIMKEKLMVLFFQKNKKSHKKQQPYQNLRLQIKTTPTS